MPRIILLFAIATCAWATEAEDRLAIAAVIGSLNQAPRPVNTFAVDAYSELDRLPAVKPKSFRTIVAQAADESPYLRISSAVWGEAEIVYPTPSYRVLVTNPEIVSGGVQFFTGSVALTEAQWKYDSQSIPLLLIMRKEGEVWKIASLRVLR